MKAKLIASTSVLMMSFGMTYVGLANADTNPVLKPRHVPLPPNITKTLPDCPTGFMKTNVSGTPDNQSWTCTTGVIECPQPEGSSSAMSNPDAKKVFGTPSPGWSDPNAVKSVNFSYNCSVSKGMQPN